MRRDRGRPDLTWLGRLLVSGSQEDCGVAVGRDVPAGYKRVLSFAALPSEANPYVLVELGSRPAEAEAIRGIGNPLTRRYRIAESLAATILRTPLGSGLLRTFGGIVHVSLPRDVTLTPNSIAHEIRAVVGREDVLLAVILGRNRPNRKPVLKILSREGDCIAFAKIGWNALSRRLVRHEAEVLSELGTATSGVSSFRVPRLIALREGRSVDILVMTPVPIGRSTFHGPPLEAPVQATREIANFRGRTQGIFGDSTYWNELKRRVAEIGRKADGGSPAELGSAVEHVEAAFGARELSFGTWHGDWTPWNMTTAEGSLFVWDWERSSGDVPVGLDVPRFAFDVLVKVKGLAPEVAADRCVASQGLMLEQVGAAPASGRLLMLLHLLEMRLRFQEAVTSGVEVDDPIYGRGLAHLLSSTPGGG
jgi:hypothetical protein